MESDTASDAPADLAPEPMDVDQAMRVLARVTTAEQEEAVAESYGMDVMGLVMAFRERLDNDSDYAFEDREAASVFRVIELLRQLADSVERDLLRHMKFGPESRTWEEVATELNSQLGGRQAAQKRWARLTAATRRTTTGDRRRGNAVRRTTVAVDESTTPAESETARPVPVTDDLGNEYEEWYQ